MPFDVTLLPFFSTTSVSVKFFDLSRSRAFCAAIASADAFGAAPIDMGTDVVGTEHAGPNKLLKSVRIGSMICAGASCMGATLSTADDD